jgi:hypothetical protein
VAGISIAFASDVRSFLKGTGDVEGALDDVGDSLDDLARDATRKGDQIGDDLQGVAREGEKAADKLERSFRDSFDEARRDAKRKTDDIADDTKRNMGKAGDATGDFKREAVSNISETASSFDGSMDSIADMVQGTFGGLADMPGVGLAAAGLAAVGGGVAAAWQAHTERIKEQVRGMFADLIESGEDYLSQSYIQEQYWAIIQGADGAILKQSELNKIVEQTGLTSSQVALAYAGDADSITRLQEVLTAKQAELAENIALAGRNGSAASINQQAELQRMVNGLDDYADRIGETTTKVDAARDAWNRYATTTAGTTQGAIDQMRDLGVAMGNVPRRIPIDVDLSGAEASLRNWRPTVTVGVAVRPGTPVVI